ncbi:MAG: HD domain-containing protein [Candidatus Wallacebacter cryptica]|nr:HD domain-containing protein [Bacillota bacterium]
MNLEEIRELAYQHLANRKAHKERELGFIYYHGQRVAKIAVKLRQLVLPNDDSWDQELTAAAYFHDIAKGIEPHAVYGSIIVREILADYCTKEQLDRISELVRWHQFRDHTKEYHDYIKILQDADTLDHFGAVEIWMNFFYYAHVEGTLEDSVEFYQTKYPEIAGRARSALNYEVSKTIFDEKHQFVLDFAKRMSIEAEGGFVDFDLR